jgi:uncharacterized lipoprotein
LSFHAKALESELQKLGFKLAEGDVEVSVEIIRFYSVFRGFNEKAIAELIMNTQVNNVSGNIIFAEAVTGEGIKPSGAMRTGEDAKVALEAAMKDAVSKLLTDTNFISALLKAAQ